MKPCRVTAFGLVMILCLIAAAPAAHAAGGAVPGGTAMIGWAGDWAGQWMARLAAWLGWGSDEPRPAEQPRAVVEAGKGDCKDCAPPPPTTSGDCSGSTDPSGTPCNK